MPFSESRESSEPASVVSTSHRQVGRRLADPAGMRPRYSRLRRHVNGRRICSAPVPPGGGGQRSAEVLGKPVLRKAGSLTCFADTVLGVDQQAFPDEKRMRLRYAGVCRVCGFALPAKAEAIYERSSKTVRCVAHEGSVDEPHPPAPIVDPSVPAPAVVVAPGTPGASARREFERRQSNREDRIRTKHPRIGGLIHALSDDLQSTKTWDIGAQGEERLGNRLNELASDALCVLHDRRIPGSKANIDHLAVTRTGIYVIDAKRYKGRPHLTVEGGLLRPRREKLLVGTRDCTKVIDGVLNQVAVVRRLIGDNAPIYGVLCFVEADWPLMGGSFTTRGVESLPKNLYPRLKADGPIGPAVLAEMHQLLAASLPPA